MKRMCFTIMIIAVITFFVGCKKDRISDDNSVKEFTLTIGNVDLTTDLTTDTLYFTAPFEKTMPKAVVKSITVGEGANSSIKVGDNLYFNLRGWTSFTVIAPDNSEKCYFVKIINSNAALDGLDISIGNVNYSATAINSDTAFFTILYSGSSVTSAKISSYSAMSNAKCDPDKDGVISFTNGMGSVSVLAQDGKTRKSYIVKLTHLQPQSATYSGGSYLGIALRDVIFDDTSVVVTIKNVANMEQSYTFGTLTGKKAAQNGVLKLTKADLGVPAADNQDLILTTGGNNITIASYKMYEIRHWKDLQAIRFNTGGHYVLMNDITLPEPVWNCNFQPIGSDVMQFIGSLDGNNRTIRNFCYNRSIGGNAGLFQHIGVTGTVSNLKMILHPKGIMARDYVGGIAGNNEGVISKCSVRGNITGRWRVGGIAGLNVNQITQCYTEGRDSSDIDSVGGIAGENDGEINNCYSTADITNRNTGYTGGVAGHNKGKIKYALSTGTILSWYDCGGIAGHNVALIANCFALNKSIIVSWKNYTSFGRIAGANTQLLTNNSANKDMLVLGTARTSTDANSLDGADLEISTLSQVVFERAGWDFNTIWKWDAVTNLPKLRE